MKRKIILKDARRTVERFKPRLPDVIDAIPLTENSKLPFKPSVLRVALSHRLSSLSFGAIAELDASRPFSAIVLARAMLETAAATFTLSIKVSAALVESDDYELNDAIDREILVADN